LSDYAFGDSALARERLGLVADTFAAPTRALLRDLPAGDRRYVLDMGCGPGYTTALLLEAFPHSFVTGIDASAAMVEEARARVANARFAVGDITAPVVLPALVVYARLVLGHLADQVGALVNWVTAVTHRFLAHDEPTGTQRSRPDAGGWPVFGPLGWHKGRFACAALARGRGSFRQVGHLEPNCGRSPVGAGVADGTARRTDSFLDRAGQRNYSKAV
jgi:SAM-dependent methyltransferase